MILYRPLALHRLATTSRDFHAAAAPVIAVIINTATANPGGWTKTVDKLSRLDRTREN